MYILQCSNGAYYTGSTVDLQKRITQHQSGNGANFTKKFLPVKLVYFEEYKRIDQAFYREKQVQGWSRAKKEALIKGNTNLLKPLAECKNESHYKNFRKSDSSTLNIPNDCSLSAVEKSNQAAAKSNQAVEKSKKPEKK